MVRNDRPSFMVRIDVNHKDRVYYAGDELRVNVRSAREGYLYLLYCNASDQVNCLYPNSIDTNNKIPALKDVVIPPRPLPGEIGFKINIEAPFGKEVLKAIVTVKPLDEKILRTLIESRNDDEKVARVRAEYNDDRSPHDWAEHHVAIETRARRRDRVVAAGGNESQPRRVGLFVGVSKYADKQIRDLSVCHSDAQAMAEVMKAQCAVDRTWVLTNEKATRKSIEHVIRHDLVNETRAGDSVIIYWSGHGSRCADEGGEEADGLDEFLVPYDGRVADVDSLRQTMILDDTFGRWLQELDGRKVLLIVDSCHSGGQGTSRSLSPFGDGRPEEFEFLDGELERAKSIGQQETGLLASSAANQVSFERREGDMSTMTYFLVAQLKARQVRLPLTASYKSLKESVTAYVEKNFPGTTQTPLLVNNFREEFLLRP